MLGSYPIAMLYVMRSMRSLDGIWNDVGALLSALQEISG